MAASSHHRAGRIRFPGTNAHPTPQAPTQVTVYPDYDGLKKSLNYYQRAASLSIKNAHNFFSPKNIPITDMCTILSIKQYDPVFCFKKDLIGDYHGESPSQHSSAQVNMIKVRSSLNNLCFDRFIDTFFNELMEGILSPNNEKYIASIIEFLIHPVGFAKSDFTFDDSKKSKLALTPLESENSGTISVKVQDKRSYLKHGTRVRWCVPVPSQWNNHANWYDEIDLKGKISLYIEPITPETDSAKLRQVFSGYFGNDSCMVDDFLQKIINAGNKSLIPFHAIPTSLKHLISVIYLNTIKMDIESGFVEMNNPYKYGSIVDYLITQGRGLPSERLDDFSNLLCNKAKDAFSKVILMTLTTIVWSRILKKGSFKNTYEEIKTRHNANLDFFVLPIDIKTDFDFDFIPFEGFSESDWETLFSTEGDACLNWTKPLIFQRDGEIKKPVTEKRMTFEKPLQYGMFGEYIFHDKQPYNFASPTTEEISRDKANSERKSAAEDFFTVAAPIFGLSVPTFTQKDSVGGSDADGYHFEHHDDPRYQLLIEDAESRADRTVLEIARTLCSELLPQTKCEQARVGWDPQTKHNIAMTTETITHNHIFNMNSEIGRVSKDISTALPEFIDAISEYFFTEEQKPLMKVIRGGCKGEKATVYFKQ